MHRALLEVEMRCRKSKVVSIHTAFVIFVSQIPMYIVDVQICLIEFRLGIWIGGMQ